MKLLYVAVVSLLCMRNASFGSPADPVRVQISDSGIKPWLSFNDGEARKAFNTAVHHQSLYFTPTLDIKPGYIKSWEWIQKDNKYVFSLNEALRYHDGRQISAEDFEFVLVKPFITKLPTTNERAPLTFIRGTQTLKPGMKFRSGMVDGIKVLSKTKVEVYLDSGHTRFLYSLGPLLPPLAPIDEFKEDLYTFKNIPVGCGPYKVAYSEPRSSMVTIEKVDKSSKGPEKIELISENRGWENKVDVAFGGGIATMRKYMKEHPGEYERIQSKLPDSIELLTFNYNSKAMQSEKLREAISLAFDKTKEIEGFLNQSPTEQIIPVLSYGYQQKKARFDRERAKQIFMGLPKNLRETEFVLSCHGSPGSDPGNYYNWVKESLESIGMKVKLVLSEETSATGGKDSPMMFVFGRYVDGNPLTAFAFYLPGTSSETLGNVPGYKVAFERAENSYSTRERAQYIQELSGIIESKNLVVPLHQNYPVYYKSKRVRSVGDELNAWTISIQNIEIN